MEKSSGAGTSEIRDQKRQTGEAVEDVEPSVEGVETVDVVDASGSKDGSTWHSVCTVEGEGERGKGRKGMGGHVMVL